MLALENKQVKKKFNFFFHFCLLISHVLFGSSSSMQSISAFDLVDQKFQSSFYKVMYIFIMKIFSNLFLKVVYS